jgi:hypothetical protein
LKVKACVLTWIDLDTDVSDFMRIHKEKRQDGSISSHHVIKEHMEEEYAKWHTELEEKLRMAETIPVKDLDLLQIIDEDGDELYVQ